METQKPLLKDKDGEEVDIHRYRSMIGSLMYLTSSRLDIMFAVCTYVRYQVNLKVSHLHAVKRIFRYLKGQPKLGLWYPKDSPFDLVAYTDSDYARASLDRKSITGGCQFLGCRLISWQCKKQIVVANSTTEADSGLMLGNTINGEETVTCLRWCSLVLEIGDTIAQTRLKLDELMALCTTLQNWVLDLEKTKTTQHNEIASLKKRVNKLEKKDRSRTHRLKRLYKVGFIARVESSDNEESLGEDAFKQGRIDAIDSDKEITLVSVHDVNVSASEEVACKRINTFEDFSTELVKGKEKESLNRVEQEITNKQKVVEDINFLAVLYSLMDFFHVVDVVVVDALPLAVKSPSIVGWRFILLGRNSYYKIMVVNISNASEKYAKWFTTASTIVNTVVNICMIIGFDCLVISYVAEVGDNVGDFAARGADQFESIATEIISAMVRDNISDCAARGADLFESIAAEIISAMVLGGIMAHRCKIKDLRSNGLRRQLVTLAKDREVLKDSDMDSNIPVDSNGCLKGAVQSKAVSEPGLTSNGAHPYRLRDLVPCVPIVYKDKQNIIAGRKIRKLLLIDVETDTTTDNKLS
ncbi:hypothetical protein Tco_0016593 [Tanacetum coccineum]